MMMTRRQEEAAAKKNVERKRRKKMLMKKLNIYVTRGISLSLDFIFIYHVHIVHQRSLERMHTRSWFHFSGLAMRQKTS